MKKYGLKAKLAGRTGETVLGSRELKTHACYMIYGVIGSAEAPRVLKPGKGHEEIILCVAGKMRIRRAGEEEILEEGEAVHLAGEESLIAEPIGGQCAYVAAGGHSEGHDHH